MSARNRYKRERRKRLAEEAVRRPKREAEILAWQEELMAAVRHNMATDGVPLELVETHQRQHGDREHERINALLDNGAAFEDAIRSGPWREPNR